MGSSKSASLAAIQWLVGCYGLGVDTEVTGNEADTFVATRLEQCHVLEPTRAVLPTPAGLPKLSGTLPNVNHPTGAGADGRLKFRSREPLKPSTEI
jgi:hypothetical protein